ncbi:hypothetical protein NX87_01045, partial [Neisseria meningitidis]
NLVLVGKQNSGSFSWECKKGSVDEKILAIYLPHQIRTMTGFDPVVKTNAARAVRAAFSIPFAAVGL